MLTEFISSECAINSVNQGKYSIAIARLERLEPGLIHWLYGDLDSPCFTFSEFFVVYVFLQFRPFEKEVFRIFSSLQPGVYETGFQSKKRSGKFQLNFKD